MRNKANYFIISFPILFLFSCSVFNKKPITASSNTEIEVQTIVNIQEEIPVYQASEKRSNDIVHTMLKVNFNWEQKKMNGEAWLKVKPYFHKTNQLVLDAKSMEILEVSLINELESEILDYDYDQYYLHIQLPRKFSREEQYEVYIKYIACPEEVKQKGSSAISMAKGLYFINSDGSEPNKPQQIWTQGQTEANSVWFPTIDDPIEKTTQEMYITVEDRFKTLSNGELVYASLNGDGTRTDYWKMDRPHSPYLFMMAIGEFSIVKDVWEKNDGSMIDVHYYVEPEYEEHAMAIFGKTPKMLNYFSKLLGVDYPWVKYHQVVVRDYVSGAMENTTATIHGEFLHQTKREIIDGGNESIIAHELFHHWFGDMVTCESWSNLPLNESFANYSQYLWDEKEYGRMEADMNAFSEMEGFFISAQQSGHYDLIRFDYRDKEDMFDGHSYNKGGRILHMLRDYLGDAVFFEGLKRYLIKHAYSTAEAHDLRMSFEDVAGEDLNWFFNQWFFAKGYPVLDIQQEYSPEKKEIKIMVTQKQNLEKWPLFKLPIYIDIYTNEGIDRKEHVILNRFDTVIYSLKNPPLLVNIDANKVVLSKKTEHKPIDQWIYQLKNAPLWLDKKEAIDQLKGNNNEETINAFLIALEHDFWNVKTMVMKNFSSVIEKESTKSFSKLKQLALTDPHPKVRAMAIQKLSLFDDVEQQELNEVYTQVLKDSSYRVISEALKSIKKVDPQRGLELAKGMEEIENVLINITIASIYAEIGKATEHEYFKTTIKELNGFNKYSFMQQYLKFILQQNDEEIESSIPICVDVVNNSYSWYVKLSGYQMIIRIKDFYNEKAQEVTKEIDKLREVGKDNEALLLEKKLNYYRSKQNQITELINELKEKETDDQVLKYIKN